MKLSVKTKSLATRCEICHQSDYFDSKTDKCLRCNTIHEINKGNSTFPISANGNKINYWGILIASIIGGIASGFGTLLLILPFLGSHWQKNSDFNQMWSIFIIPLNTMLGEIVLPCLLSRKRVTTKIIIKLLIWAIVGGVGAILIPNLLAIIQILYVEFDSFVIHKQALLNLCKSITVGVLLGPVIGVITSRFLKIYGYSD